MLLQTQKFLVAGASRSGTAAAKLPDLAPQVKKQRLHRLMQLAGQLRAEYEGRFVGKVLELVPEEQKGGCTVGYSENYIRLYVPGEAHGRLKVRALRPFEDGLLAERA